MLKCRAQARHRHQAGIWIVGTASCSLLLAPLTHAAKEPISKQSTVAKSAAAPAMKQLQGDARIIHALNRLAFGPRPGDIERVRQVGLERWIDQQLTPATTDDTEIDTKLNQLSTLKMPSSQLMLAYTADTAAFIRMLAKEGKMPGMMDVMKMDGDEMARPQRNRPNKVGTGQANGTKAQVNPIDLGKLDLKPEQRRLLEEIEKSGLPRGLSVQAIGELSAAKIARAVDSNRQFQEVLVDFWSNHFNLDIRKGPVRALKVTDEREAIRPHVLGKFRDLLGASAKSPAMLVYLDNARSTREYGMAAGNRRGRLNKPAQQQQRPNRGGLNENYARELMELHTLGVDGGYTQKDVQEVARCLTGWSIERQTGEFRFYPFRHDEGAKTVLGTTIPAGGGIQDGEKVLDILAAHPSTARFIARKLCVRLVADQPPAALIERAAKTFEESKGDLKAVVKTIISSPEFFSSDVNRTKIKSPFEFAVSSMRALGGTVDVPNPALTFGRLRLVLDGATSLGNGGNGVKGLLRRYEKGPGRKSLAEQIAHMGQPLFAYQAPTGYTENSQEWVSAGSLIARLNFALALTGGEVSDATISLTNLLQGVTGDDHDKVLDRLSHQILGTNLSPSTRAVIKKQLPTGTPANAARVAALILGSPEFQRR